MQAPQYKHRWFGWQRQAYRKVFYLLGIPVIRKKTKPTVSLLMRELVHIKQLYIPASVRHPEIFGKYKGCHRGQDVVIVATGPTLDDYTPIPGAVHIGVNRSFQAAHVPLDYLFAIDDLNVPVETLASYRPDECKKFIGHNISVEGMVNIAPEYVIEACHAQRFYYEPAAVIHPWQHIPIDISCSPLMVYESVITAAFQFALWTRPRRIFLVGCDCSNGGYFKQEKSEVPQFLRTGPLGQAWGIMKNFAERVYPDVEIISINPVGLRGLFIDKYTK